MNNFKMINVLNTLHIAEFQLKYWRYEVYFSAVQGQQDINFTLPDDLTLSFNSCYEVLFDHISNSQKNQHYARAPVGAMAITVLRNVIRMLLKHYETYQVGLYVFEAADDELFLFYHSILRLLIERFKGFSVNPINGGKNYVIKTPAYCPAAFF